MQGFSLQPTIDISAPDEEVDVGQTLSDLDALLPDIGAQLKPGAEAAAIAAAEERLGCRFPAKLRQLYLWHDGGTGLVPAYDWLSLEELADEYESLRELESVPGDLLPLAYLPVFRFDGQQHISIDCDPRKGGALYFSFLQDPGLTPVYRGVGHLLAMTSHAYRQGIVRNRGSYFEVDQARMYDIRREHAVPEERRRMEENWRGIESSLRNAHGTGFQVAARWLEHVPDRRAVPILMGRLDDEDPEVVALAAYYLGDLRAEEALPRLTELLSHDNSSVRNLAGAAISDFPKIPPATTAKLVELLNDAEDLATISAIEALGNVRAAEAVEPLVNRLSSSRPGIQQYIVRALGEIGDRRALPALLALRDELATQDMSIPDKGGTRGSDPPPSRLKAAAEEAIRKLGG